MFTSKSLLKFIWQNVIISLIIIVLSVVIIFFIKSKTSQITDAVVLNHKLETELRKKTELFLTIEHDAQIIGNNYTLINNAFVPSNNISEFINKLDNLASSNSIIQMYRFDTPTTSELSGPFPLSVIPYANSLVTDISNFSKYLKSFEKLPYFTKIENMNISSQDKLGWIGTSTISFQATLLTKAIQ